MIEIRLCGRRGIDAWMNSQNAKTSQQQGQRYIPAELSREAKPQGCNYGEHARSEGCRFLPIDIQHTVQFYYG